MKKIYLICLVLWSCQTITEKKNNPSINETETNINAVEWDDDLKGYLALGDSYTIGEAVAENRRWPNQLVNKWNKNNAQYNPAEIIARTGWTTDELLDALDDSPPLRNTYDKVSLLIGVNNQYRGRSIAEFEDQLVVLIQKAIGYGGEDVSNVFLVSIPDWGVMPFAEGRDRQAIALQIDSFNTVVRKQAENFGIAFVDITPISRQATENNRLIATDGLHPSGYQYTLWANAIINTLESN